MSDIGSIADKVIGRLLETVASGDAERDNHLSMEHWEWPQGVALYGILGRYRAEGRPEDLGSLQDWYARRIAAGLPARNVNTTAPLLTLASLSEPETRPEWLKLVVDWADWVMRAMPRTEEGGIQHVTSHLANEGELWADTLFMAVLFLAKAGILLGRGEYLDEAGYQFLIHARYLQDPQTGLWYHGWSFAGRHRFGAVRWARGNSWFAAAAVEYLELAPPSGAMGRTIAQVFRSQARALLRLQDAAGLWRTVLDDESSYLESSASAAIAYALHKGARLGLLGDLGAEARAASLRAAEGLISRIAADGSVAGVSHGTAVGMDAAHYKAIRQATTAYGQGLAFLMLNEMREESLDGIR